LFLVQGSEFRVPGSEFRVQKFGGFRVFGLCAQAVCSEFLEFEILNLKSQINPEPETRNNKLGTLNQKLETRNPNA
jgi:hypothetical protein